MITVSGTAPIDDSGATVSQGDLYQQTRRCMEIMLDAAREAGGRPEHVVRTRIYLKDAQQWNEAARAHQEFFKDARPACTFLEVKGFINPDWLVETEMDCVIHDE